MPRKPDDTAQTDKPEHSVTAASEDKAEAEPTTENPRISEETPVVGANSVADVQGKPRKLARYVAVVLAALAALCAVLSYWLPQLQICRSVTGGTNFAAVESCNPWTPSDLIPVALIVLLLVAADYNELSVFNLITLKREVKAQATEIRANGAKVDALDRVFSMQLASLQANQHVETSVHNSYYYSPEAGVDVPRRVDEKGEDLRGNDKGRPWFRMDRHGVDSAGGGASGDPADAEYALLAVKLVSEWEKFTAHFGGLSKLMQLMRSNDDRAVNPADMRFLSIFGDEIDTVRKIRNNVAHSKYVSREDLQGAVDGVVKLNEILSRAPE